MIDRLIVAHSPMLAVGAFSEHARIAPILVFTFMWATLVYDPIACWTWNSNGWSFVLGGLDFAGVSTNILLLDLSGTRLLTV